LLAFLTFDWLHACLSYAWWNDQWEYRRKITLDTTANGVEIGESLTEVPLLVRLHTGNFDFTNARSGGEDIRFVSGDDTTLLKHHIEKIDPLEEIAYVWMKVPRLPGNANQEFIWLYYGSEDAVGIQETGGTYDIHQVVVYHFNETQGIPRDATANQNDAAEFTGGQGFPAVIGNGVVFNGISNRLRIPVTPPVNFENGLTFSAWLRIANPQTDAHLFSYGNENGRLVIGIQELQLYGQVTGADGQTVAARSETARLSVNTWHHVAVTAAPQGALTVYIDGAEVARADLPGPLPQAAGDLFVGASPEGTHFYAGELDELQLSVIPRSPGWIRVAVGSQDAEAALYQVGVEIVSEGGGLPVFYLVTVMKNITLDGWVIIGILVTLMITSWMIIISKSIFTWLVDRENKRFIEAYSVNGNPIRFEPEAGRFSNASLFKLYQTGKDTLRPWIDDEAVEKTVPKKAVDAFRAALDRGYIEESKRINAWLVVLTFAITGGPFLGLLGTVWGVMNTFAAMAEAGEANIMAIAPGVASALSTTVFGLIVAIPALFAYNFITSKIKSISVDMNVFIDEYALKVEQAYVRD
jgi:biopolymer transport protein ExbB